MFNYLSDKSFVESALARGNIPFIVRGSLECEEHFDFKLARMEVLNGIRVSGPTFHLRVIGEHTEQENAISVFVSELYREKVFAGEIELPEKNIEGISKALSALELWADFLCLAAGNPKIKIEVQLPLNIIVTARSKLEPAALDGELDLIVSYARLETSEKKRVASALWWFRKACAAADYSLFDSYTANWNCLEILCGVSGGQIKQGPEVDKAIQDYLNGLEKTTAKDIHECHNKFVNYSIARQMKDALDSMRIGQEQGKQLVYQCFEILPPKDRLWQTRNDINHGNIRENSPQDLERVYLRGLLLSRVVWALLYYKLGYPGPMESLDINESAKRIAGAPWRSEAKE